MLNDKFGTLMGLDFMTEQSALEDIMYNGNGVDLAIESQIALVDDQYYEEGYKVRLGKNPVVKASGKGIDYGKKHAPTVRIYKRKDVRINKEIYAKMKEEEEAAKKKAWDDWRKAHPTDKEKVEQEKRRKIIEKALREKEKIDREAREAYLRNERARDLRNKAESEAKQYANDNTNKIIFKDVPEVFWKLFLEEFYQNKKYSRYNPDPPMPWYIIKNKLPMSEQLKFAKGCWVDIGLDDGMVNALIQKIATEINQMASEYRSVEQFIQSDRVSLDKIYMSLDLTMDGILYDLDCIPINAFINNSVKINYLAGYLKIILRNLDLRKIAARNTNFLYTINRTYKYLYDHTYDELKNSKYRELAAKYLAEAGLSDY